MPGTVNHLNRVPLKAGGPELLCSVVTGDASDTFRADDYSSGKPQTLASVKDLPAPYSDVTAIPTTFFIDRNGVITKILVGYNDYEALKAEALAPDYQGAPAAEEKPAE